MGSYSTCSPALRLEGPSQPELFPGFFISRTIVVDQGNLPTVVGVSYGVRWSLGYPGGVGYGPKMPKYINS